MYVIYNNVYDIIINILKLKQLKKIVLWLIHGFRNEILYLNSAIVFGINFLDVDNETKISHTLIRRIKKIRIQWRKEARRKDKVYHYTLKTIFMKYFTFVPFMEMHN